MYTKKIKLRRTRRGGASSTKVGFGHGTTQKLTPEQRRLNFAAASDQRRQKAAAAAEKRKASLASTSASNPNSALQARLNQTQKPPQVTNRPSRPRGRPAPRARSVTAPRVQLNVNDPLTSGPSASLNSKGNGSITPQASTTVQNRGSGSNLAVPLQAATPLQSVASPPPATPRSTSADLDRIKAGAAVALRDMKAAVDKLAEALGVQSPAAESPEQTTTSKETAAVIAAKSAPASPASEALNKPSTTEAPASASGEASAIESLNKEATSIIEQAGTIQINTPEDIEAGTVLIRDLLKVTDKIIKINTDGKQDKLIESIRTAMTKLQAIIDEKKKGTTIGGGNPVEFDLYYPKNSYLTPT